LRPHKLLSNGNLQFLELKWPNREHGCSNPSNAKASKFISIPHTPSWRGS
jgi:hypothetical protein